MLHTDDRTLLVDAFAPPSPEYRLVHVLGTTFTLSLDALIRIPMATMGAEWSQGDDGLGVIHALQRSADRIDVFCQAGMVNTPTSDIGLLSFPENVVHQIKAPPGGLFHPKIWLLRFVNDDGDERIRLLCGSRNITNDRTWDALVCLEGNVEARRFAQNIDLADFVRSLISRVTIGLPSHRQQAIEKLADRIPHVAWEPPRGVASKDWFDIHVLGHGRQVSIRLLEHSQGRRWLIMSPFLNDAWFNKSWQDWNDMTVVSRPEALGALDPKLRQELVDEHAAEF